MLPIHIILSRFSEELKNVARCLKSLRRRSLGEELATILEDMARFGNLLVHRYGETDNRRVLEIIKHNPKDIEEIEREIEKSLKR
jgi:uncharacterized protein YutE (UPF0331/DUF86 family)